ncbi:hypothetical protein CBS101457_006552 [Exobasidium rhododendri]|nr:hypothetical protein CBS101457_006552 [Exobasidium rhododendri]
MPGPQTGGFDSDSTLSTDSNSLQGGRDDESETSEDARKGKPTHVKRTVDAEYVASIAEDDVDEMEEEVRPRKRRKVAVIVEDDNEGQATDLDERKETEESSHLVFSKGPQRSEMDRQHTSKIGCGPIVKETSKNYEGRKLGGKSEATMMEEYKTRHEKGDQQVAEASTSQLKIENRPKLLTVCLQLVPKVTAEDTESHSASSSSSVTKASKRIGTTGKADTLALSEATAKEGKRSRTSRGLFDVDIASASYDSLFDGGSSPSDSEMDAIKPKRSKTRRSCTLPKATSREKRPTSSLERKESKIFENDASSSGDLIEIEGIFYQPQYTQCQSIKTYGMGKIQSCRHCVAKQVGDSCRFRHIRALFKGIKEGRGKSPRHGQASSAMETEAIFIDDLNQDEEASLPDHFDLNRAMDQKCREEIMFTSAKSLIHSFEAALRHAQQPGCIRRTRELQIRAMCDFCSTGIFASSYMCKRCGGEYCLACQDAMATVNEEEMSKMQLFTCVKDYRITKYTKRNYHSTGDFIPVTRFSLAELECEVEDMRRVIKESSSCVRISDKTEMTRGNEVFEGGQAAPQRLAEEGEDYDDDIIVPTHLLVVEDKCTLDEDKFLATWAKGEPLVVDNIRTRVTWDPNAFEEKYGDMYCDIVRCDAVPPLMDTARYRARMRDNPSYFDKWAKLVNVRTFFQTFGKSVEEREAMIGEGIWKLKASHMDGCDWPPAAEFQTFFPDIYEDFNYAVPMPDYTRRDGCKNLSSLFPKNVNGPDLGPKMYNAWTGEHSKGKKGTTCLHMDIADAVNILLHSEEMDNHESAAQWDIFRAEDANLIREFLMGKHPSQAIFGDPIHAQTHYLDDEALKQLYREKGVYSWRILQKAGQSVFIPAGCAHQVCNLTDCIKVAVDFISPQNVARCFKLTEEFRGLTVEGKKSWKEDVLQLKAQLWYAWKACKSIGDPPSKELFDRERGQREEKRRFEADEVRKAEEARLRKVAARPRRKAGRSLLNSLDASSTSDGHENEAEMQNADAASVRKEKDEGDTIKQQARDIEQIDSIEEQEASVEHHPEKVLVERALDVHREERKSGMVEDETESMDSALTPLQSCDSQSYAGGKDAEEASSEFETPPPRAKDDEQQSQQSNNIS